MEGYFIMYQGHLREVIAAYKNSLVIDNGVNYIFIPVGIYDIIELSRSKYLN